MIPRIYHPWQEWECYKAGFYKTTTPDGISNEEALRMYATFLKDTPRFNAAMERVLKEWPNSCEHFLTNENINRIAWLGQSSMCIATGIPSCFKSGFKLLSHNDQTVANTAAEVVLNKYMASFKTQGELF